MIFYAVQQSSTGRYLPERKSEDRGYTHLEPADPVERPPRLFVDKRSASSALTHWLKGRAEVTYGNIDWATGSYDGNECLEYVPVEGRRREDMAVVPMMVELAAGKVVVDSVDLRRALEYIVSRDEWNSGMRPDWLKALTAACEEMT